MDRPKLQQAIVLHVRAAENLVPLALYDQALAPHVARDKEGHVPIRALQLFERSSPPEWRVLVNLKHGVTLFEVETMEAGSAEAVFWSDVSSRTSRDQCIQSNHCKKKEECHCHIIEGLGDKALERAVDWIRDQRPARVANLLGIPGDAELTGLCEQVVAWGLAFPRLLT